MNISRKKTLIISFILSILALIVPTQNANADFVGDIAGSILKILSNPAEIGLSIFLSLLVVPLAILILLGIAFFIIANLLLSAVISPFFISLSYTNPAGNPILDVGWTLTRDLANMGFVIALVYIGLATSLRLTGIETKKTLINLILIALLINFTPIICGIIVDASNIVMNFFLEGITGFDAMVNIGLEQLNSLWGIVTSLTDLSLASTLSAIAKVVVFVLFNFLAGFVLFLFALLFLARYVAIWTLVILSPLAFFCYILPNTRDYFSQWWQQLLNWSFVGAVAGFFLYLSQYLLMMTTNGELTVGAIPSGATGDINIEGLINTFLPYMIVVVFLFIGLIASLGIGAAGAAQIITTAKTTGTKAGKWAQKEGWKWTKGKAKEKMPEGVRRKAERLAAFSPKGKLTKPLYEKTPLGWGVRKAVAPIVGIPETQRAEAEAVYKLAEKRDAAGNALAYRQASLKTEKAAILSAMIKKGQMKEAKDIGFVLPEKDIESAFKTTIRMKDKDMQERIERGFIKDYGDKFKDWGGNSKEDIIKKANTEDKIKELQKEWYKEKDLLEIANRRWIGHQIGISAKINQKDFIDRQNEFVREHNLDWYIKNENQAIPLYHATNAAQGYGLENPFGTREQIREAFETPRKIKEGMEFIEREIEKGKKEAEKKKDRKKKDRKKKEPHEVGKGK